MNHEDEVNGVKVNFNDGDEDTNHITELHGQVALKHDAAHEYLRIRELTERGFQVMINNIIITSSNIFDILCKRFNCTQESITLTIKQYQAWANRDLYNW